MSVLRLMMLVAALLAAPAAWAVLPGEQLSDPALEARARTISQNLRCVVCQNQTIDDSDAPLARDLRVIVRERLVAGDSDAQVMDYLVARYGNFVLMRPPFALGTVALWLGPFAMLLLGAIGVAGYLRRRAAPENSVLAEDERAALDRLLGGNDR